MGISDLRSALASSDINKTDGQLDLSWNVERKGELMNLGIMFLDKNLIPQTRSYISLNCLWLPVTVSSIQITAVSVLYITWKITSCQYKCAQLTNPWVFIIVGFGNITEFNLRLYFAQASPSTELLIFMYPCSDKLHTRMCSKNNETVFPLWWLTSHAVLWLCHFIFAKNTCAFFFRILK